MRKELIIERNDRVGYKVFLAEELTKPTASKKDTKLELLRMLELRTRLKKRRGNEQF